MKRLRDLTADDLAKHPIWVCEGDSDATATVHLPSAKGRSDKQPHIAAARFTLADGSEWPGYCSLTQNPQLAYAQPVIITHGGHAPLWYDSPPPWPEPQHTCELLGRPPEEVFPIRYECLVPSGSELRGTIAEVSGYGLAEPQQPVAAEPNRLPRELPLVLLIFCFLAVALTGPLNFLLQFLCSGPVRSLFQIQDGESDESLVVLTTMIAQTTLYAALCIPAFRASRGLSVLARCAIILAITVLYLGCWLGLILCFLPVHG